MLSGRLAVLLLTLALVPTTVAGGELVSYISDVLDQIERHALAGAAVDWPKHRADALAWAAEAETSEEAYALIDETLALLGDRHSHLRRPGAPSPGVAIGAAGGFAGAVLDSDSLTVLAVYPHSPAEAAGLARGDRVVRVDGQPVTPANAGALPEAASRVGARLQLGSADGATRVVITSPREFSGGLPPAAYRIGERVAVLELPTRSGSGTVPGVGDYAELAHEALAAHADACGWVVDLRLNAGGNIWPMLSAAGPLLGEGDLGGFLLKGGALGVDVRGRHAASRRRLRSRGSERS